MAGVLLAYLPHAENESVLDELKSALIAVAYDDMGVADPSVVKALGDKQPLRRAAAAVALAQVNMVRHQDDLRKLLKDPAPSVRLPAALALAGAGEPEAISTLIDLLGDLVDKRARESIEDFLTNLAGELGPKVALGEDETARRKARDAWARWWHDTEGMGLLDELKKRTISDVDRDKVQALVRKLSDDDFKVREKAEGDLIHLGVSVLPLLKQEAQKNPDTEARRRVQRCVLALEAVQEKFVPLLPAVARLITLRKPPGVAEAILAYLPSLDSEELSEELQHALDAVAFSDGKPQPAVLNGLTDKAGVRRAAAAAALCAGRRADHLETVRKLLNDPEPAVRLKVSLALAGARDPSGVPTLISLVAELPPEQAPQAEDYLNKLAGGNTPKGLPDGKDEENRKKRSEIWSSWWQTHKGKVVLIDPFDPADRERPGPASRRSVRGYTLLVQTQTNTVTELGPDGKPRWALTELLQPSDAEVLSGQRVLLAEQNRVTERNLQGKVLWQKVVPAPLSAQRLHNGNTFIACQTELLEVDRSGKEVQKIDLAGVRAARKLPDGRVVAYVGGQRVEFDRKGREVKRVQVPGGGGGCNEVLDNGHILVSSPGIGSLIEADGDGQEIHRFDMPGVTHGFRLPNGHTLVTINGTRYIELDGKWQPLKETPLATPAFRVKRR
jgi:hypothetical protein